jgi:transposase
VLLAEIGEDRDHYPTPETLLAEAGLAPVTRSSGRSHRVRFRYAANTRLRDAVMWCSYNSLKESTWAADACRQARRPRPAPLPRPARSRRPMDRILWRCWTNHTTYDPAVHLKTNNDHAKQAAAA